MTRTAPGVVVLLLVTGSPAAFADLGFTMVDIAAESGVVAPTICGLPDKGTILGGTGPGLALLDYDGDGLLDVFLHNGGTVGDPEPVHVAGVLYRNLGGGRFEDVTVRAGVGDRHFGSGATAADLDGDGDVDLFLSNFGRNTLYRNNGDGTFEDATLEAGLGDPGWGTGTSLADTDRDGDLDLYVANYVHYDRHTTPRLGNPRCIFMGVEVFCGPRGLRPGHDLFYRNRGDGTFDEVSREVGLRREEPYYGLGVVFGDLDSDGDADLYVADDATPNLLFLNDGTGRFSEEALIRGVAFSQEGVEQAGMGTDMGDYDGDGRIDLIVTNFSHDTHALYRNMGAMFDVATFDAGLGEPTLPRLGWGVGFVDFDGDGWDDLFFSNGHVYPQMDGRGLGTAYRQPNQILRNQGDGTFRDVSKEAGPGMTVVEPSRGAVFGDLEGDGDPDVVILNLDAPPTVLRNDRSSGHRWLGLVLHGRGSNTDAVGARARLTADGRSRVRDVRAGSAYLSQNDLRLRFGLGEAAAADTVEVHWPDGGRITFRGLPAGRYHHLRQGS